MLRDEYLSNLKDKLAANNIPGIDSMIDFYDEAISDRIEDGMSEEDAVAAMEDADEVVKSALLDKPIAALMMESARKKHQEANEKGHGALFVVLTIIGFPIWFPLLVAFFAILFSIYIAMWAIVVSIYAVELAFAITAVASFFACFTFMMGQIPFATAIALLGCALIFAGLAILLWKPVVIITKWMIKIIKEVFRSIKKIFVK